MKLAVYQVAVGNVPAYYQTCIDSVARYCASYGIHHHVQTEPQLKIKPLNNKRLGRSSMKLDYLPIYEKENAFDLLYGYDKVAIIDADIYIRDTAPDIFDEIDADTAFAGVRECDMPVTPKYLHKIQGFSTKQYEMFPQIMQEHTEEVGVPFYNMGLMLLTPVLLEYLNGETPEQFIRRKEFEGFVNGEGHWKWSTDQTLLNYWVKSSGMPVKNLSWKWNALYKGIRDEKLPNAHFIHFFLSANLPRGGKEIPDIIKGLN
jgi:hypothetical protein